MIEKVLKTHLQISRLLIIEMHAYVRAHPAQRVPAVPADGAAERLDAGVRLHVPLRRRRRRRHHLAAGALPPALRPRRRPRRLHRPRRPRLPLRAVVRLVRRQVVQRAEVDPAGQANQLPILRRRPGLRRRGTRSLLTAP